MAVTAFVFHSVPGVLANEEVDLASDTLKVMLLSAVPVQATDDYLDDVVGDEVSGTGYTAGGPTLSGVTWALSGGIWKLGADDVSLPASTITARAAVVYDDTPATNATKPLLACVDFGEERSTLDTAFQINWHATNGVFRSLVGAPA